MSSKYNIKIAPGAIVCNECELKGDITIGTKTVIHPKAKIIAESGPIIIGENNLIEEQCEILNIDPSPTNNQNESVMIIGNNNIFEDFSSVLKNLDLNDGSEFNSLGRYNFSGSQASPSPTKSTRSSLGLLPPGALENISIVDSVDGSIHFPKMSPNDMDGNSENIPPKFFKPRFEIESGILDEDGETDLENFLDDKDIKQLDDMYTPATTSDSDSDVMSTCSGKETVVNQDGKAASKIVKQPPGPVGASLGLIRSGAMLGAVKDNVNYGSSSDELAVPLERTYNSPVDKDGFARPLPPGDCTTPRAALRPRPCINTSTQGIPASLFLPNDSHNVTRQEVEHTPSLPPRAPTGWGSFLDKSSNMPTSNQQSFNCSGFPWEQLVPKDAGNTSVAGVDQEKASPGQNQSLGGTGMNMSKAAETSVALETSCMGPLDPSFYSGKISARSTSLGPSGEIGDRTLDDNFSDFSKPASFRSSYSSNYTTQDESIVHSGFPPIMSVSGQPFSASLQHSGQPFSASLQQKNPFDNPSLRQSGSSVSGGFDNPFQTSKSSALYNPFDVDKHNMSSQPVDEEFREMDASYNMEDFLAAEEAECLQKHNFIQEEDMDKDSGDTSMMSGVSDKSIVLRNNGLWAGNTSQVNLDKLREETRLSRDEYFRLKSSRLGCLEGSMTEVDRPDFGFLHKIRSPEHKPSPLLDESCSDSSSNRNTYHVATPTFDTPEVINDVSHEGRGGASGGMEDNECELPPQYFNISGSSNNSAHRKPSLTDGQETVPSSADSSYLHSGDSTKTLTSMNSSDLQFKDLAQRLEALTEDSGGPNVSYPDVVEASINQSREFEKSLSSFVDGEINLSTISRALSDANVSLDPQQFVNLIKNTFTAQKRSQVETKGGSKDEDKTPVPSPFVDSLTKAPVTAGQPAKDEAITTTPKTSAANDSLNYKARRNIAENKPQSPTTDMITESIRKNIKPLSSGSKQPSSVSAPVTPRDTPVPPLSKSTSVPYSIESSGRRRNPSGSKHSSPKKSPKKVVIRTVTPQGLEDLLESGDHTPSMFVTHRKHLQTSTPYHPNLNLSSVIMDNLVTGDKSISPFVNPDLSINAANLDKGVGGLPPVKHMTPTTASGYTEVQVGSDSLHHSSVLHMSDSFNIDQVLSSHCWQVLKIPVVHAAMQQFKAVMKITSIWIGSVEIPPEYWNQILSMSSTESVIIIGPATDVLELHVFARREGAFAINLGLISPGGHTSSGIVRFQIEEPILRLLTRNGHTVDFGTVVHKASSSAQVMLVNGGSSNLNLSLEIISDSELFSFSEDKAEKTTQFVIPGCAKTSVQGEGIMKELKIWAITNTINKKHVEPCVYTGQLEIKLGAKDSKVVLGKVQIILRVCFSGLVMKPSNMLEFTCGEGKKCSQRLEITCEGNQPLDVEASMETNTKGTFIFDKKFKVFPGVSKFLAIEFVSRPGYTGNDSSNLNLKMLPGGISYKVEMRTKVLSKQQESIFATNASPGLKLGLLAAEESIDRFPVDANKNLMNWFAVAVGEQEAQQISLRNYYNFPVTLNVMIRDTDEFYLKEATESDTNTMLSFKPHETKTCAVVYRPKTTKPVKGKLVLKPANIKIGGKIFKASITLQGHPGAAAIKLIDLKSTDEAKFFLDIDQEPPVSRQFKIENSGTATGFVKIVCLETMSHSEDSSVTISPSEFLLKSGDSKLIYLTFGAEYTSLEANLAIFCGTELVRHVYTRARKLPGSVRLSGSRALLGLDFTKPIGDGDDQDNITFTGDITSEDASHFYNKSQKLQVRVSLKEKQADFHSLGVEETMSASRLETTAMAAIGNVKNKWDQLTASPPTPDCSTISRILHILPQNLSLTAGTESIVKIINKSSDTLHWDLNWPEEMLDCSPPAGQLARGGQAIILVSAKADAAVGAQCWRGRVEVFSEQTVDYINVVMKPKTVNIKCLLEASPPVLDFGLVSQGNNEKKVLSLTNKSQEAMVQWKAFPNGSDIFELSQYAGILNPTQTVNLAVSFKPAHAGPVSAVVDIISQIVKGSLKEGGESQYLTTSVEMKGVAVAPIQLDGQNNVVKVKSVATAEAGTINPKLKEPATVSVPVNGGPKQVDESRQQRQAKAVLSLESDSISFGSVPVGRSQISKVTVKNKTGQSQMIYLSLEPGSPFIIIHDKVEMKSQSFSKIPVYFRPTCSGRFGAHLKISSDTGWSTVATLHGTGVIAEETAALNV